MANWRLPTKAQVKALPHLLSPRERQLFVVFFVIFLIAFTWTAILIDRKYSTLIPANGGSLHEGSIGSPLKINPLLAISDVDRDLVDLVYAGLMRADGNGGLQTELAERYELSEDGLVYTFTLKENLYWHDGKRVTAKDVVFTINKVKTPAIGSPRRANWEGVEVRLVDDRTVEFVLQRPYAPFLENTALGILPEHIWESLTAEEFNLTDRNLSPIGAGPYKFENFKKRQNGTITSYKLKPFKDYLPHSPYLRKITFSFFPNTNDLISAYNSGKIDAMRVGPENIDRVESVKDLSRITLPKIFTVFFNQENSTALANDTVREALDLALNREALINAAVNGYAVPQHLPIFIDQVDFSATGSTTAALALLEDDGWEKGEDGLLSKTIKNNTTPLAFTLSTSNNSELVATAEELKRQWEDLGARVDIQLLELTDLEQTRIRPRQYEALLFGQIVGFHPDPFAFWHSSQRNDPGFNISLYANPSTDSIVENIRRNITPEERNEEFTNFATELMADRPAIFLYSPVEIYLIDKKIRGNETQRITLSSERFTLVEEWHRNTQSVWNIFLR